MDFVYSEPSNGLVVWWHKTVTWFLCQLYLGQNGSHTCVSIAIITTAHKLIHLKYKPANHKTYTYQNLVIPISNNTQIPFPKRKYCETKWKWPIKSIVSVEAYSELMKPHMTKSHQRMETCAITLAEASGVLNEEWGGISQNWSGCHGYGDVGNLLGFEWCRTRKDLAGFCLQSLVYLVAKP